MAFNKKPLAIILALPALWQTAIAQSNPTSEAAQSTAMTEVVVKATKLGDVEPGSTLLDAAGLAPLRAGTSTRPASSQALQVSAYTVPAASPVCRRSTAWPTIGCASKSMAWT